MKSVKLFGLFLKIYYSLKNQPRQLAALVLALPWLPCGWWRPCMSVTWQQPVGIGLSQLFVDHEIRKLEIRIKNLAIMAYENSNSILHKSFCRLYLTRLTNYFFNQTKKNQLTVIWFAHFFRQIVYRIRVFDFFLKIKDPGHIC